MALERSGVRVDIRNIGSLLPHEDTIPSRVELLASEIDREGVQKDPVVVDANTGTVLDGMHRLAAFSKLGIPNIVCYPVEYRSMAISLGRWARMYSRVRPSDAFRTLAKSGVARKEPVAKALELLEAGKGGLVAIVGSDALMPDDATDLSGALAIVRLLDEAAEDSGWNRSFVSTEDVSVAARGEGRLAVLVQKLSKDDVLGAASTGRLFPCKTSMHEVDPRPVAVNLPTDDLDHMTGPKLRARLSGYHPRFLPPNSTYEGRRYKERLLVLKPDD